MKKYITDLLYFLPFLALFIFANCSGNKRKKSKKRANKTLRTIEQYAKLDVCGCNEEGNNILDNSILVINKFKNKSELKKDSNSTKLIKSYAKTWTIY